MAGHFPAVSKLVCHIEKQIVSQVDDSHMSHTPVYVCRRAYMPLRTCLHVSMLMSVHICVHTLFYAGSGPRAQSLSCTRICMCWLRTQGAVVDFPIDTGIDVCTHTCMQAGTHKETRTHQNLNHAYRDFEKGHDYTGQNYTGHNYIGHNYIILRDFQKGPRAQFHDLTCTIGGKLCTQNMLLYYTVSATHIF